MLKNVLKATAAVALALFVGSLYAASAQSLGSVASIITGSFSNVTKLITALSYIAGVGFGVGAILKFKQHKDNSTQIPIGTPIAMTMIAAALLFFPTVLGVSGQTIFGGQQEVASPTGTVFSIGGGG